VRSLITEGGEWNLNELLHAPMPWIPLLRITQEILGHRIAPIDGKPDQVQAFILDDETKIIRYLIIETRKREAAKVSLLSPAWIEGMYGKEKPPSTPYREQKHIFNGAHRKDAN
jgi:hypothetical protein